MKSLLPLLAALALPACGGLYSATDGGTGGGTGGQGLGPPTCMRTFSDAIAVKPPPAPNAFTDIVALQFDKDRHLVVLTRKSGGAFVVVMGAPPNTGFLKSWGAADLTADVQDFVLDAAGNAYVLEDPEFGDPVVKKFDANGKLVSQFTADAMGFESLAISIAIDGAGKLNIGGTQRLYRYELNGTFIDKYGTPGKGVGQLMWPTDLVWDAKSNALWVADVFHNAVEAYTPGEDAQVAQFGSRGTADGKFDGNEPSGNTFYGPNAIAIDAQGDVYASDPYASRLQKLAPNGAFKGQFTFGTSRVFDALALDPATGILYAGRGAAIDVICPF